MSIPDKLSNDLNSISEFWFSLDSKKKWIETNRLKRNIIDLEITDLYQELLEYLEFSPICKLIDNFSTVSLVNIIVCLDQFTRHIYRDNNTKIYENTKKAVVISNYICFNNDIYTIEKDRVMFVLMPLKHIDNYKNFIYIRRVISKIIDLNTNDQSNLYKFYLDSLKKYLYSRCTLNKIEYIDSEFKLDDVCEFYSDIPKIDIEEKERLYNVCYNFLRTKHFNELTISLSGGPDSMVLAFIMNDLSIKLNIKLKAFHINYNNRQESGIEELVISQFCKNINLDLYVYRFNFIKRGNVDREFYEKITRNIRFKMYELLGGQIILGHIKEDLIENIWTNFSKGRDLFKLHKMDEVSHIDNVLVLRPFLKTDKADIYDFAKKYNISYLKNTTPTWSNRGKLRNEFLPQVEKQFGIETYEKILYLSESLESYKKILDSKIFTPLYDSVINLKSKECLNIGIMVNLAEYLCMNMHFWQDVLTKLFHGLNSSMPSIKSIRIFFDRINQQKIGFLTLKHEFICYLDEAYNLYILDRTKLVKFKTLNWNSIKSLIK